MDKKEKIFQAKYFHITIHQLDTDDKNLLVEKAKTIRPNTVAVLVGLEENNDEGKGLHAHIFVQLSTRQKLTRAQLVKHFDSECINIGTRSSKHDLMQGLGYVSKTGNTLQWGVFTYRGVEVDTDPEVYRFNYVVNSKIDAIRYFKQVIDEALQQDQNKNIIKEYAKRKDAIGDYLVANPSVTNSLHKLAYTWYLDHANAKKRGFTIPEWVHDHEELKKQYSEYLKEFPVIFEAHKTTKSEMVLEVDYADHVEHEVEALITISALLSDALKYGSRRPEKSLNIYIWSEKPSFGKTRLLSFLDDNLMAYRLPDDQYYVDYEDDLYQVLVSDEAASFLKTKDYSHLKHVMEGRTVEFNLKGREKVYKSDNPLIILADNVSFDTLMTRHFYSIYNHDVMSSRVKDIELRSRATLHFFLDRCLVANK